MAEVHIAWMDIVKLRVTAYWGPLVILDWGREGIFFTCSQVNLGWSQNSFNIPVGFTLTLEKIHGTKGEFTVKLTSEIILKRGQFSLIIEGSILTGLIATGPNMFFISSETFKVRVPKSDQ